MKTWIDMIPETRKLTVLSVFILMFFCSEARTVRGTVKDGATGEGIPGASITVKDRSSCGTVSDIDGSFSIDVEDGCTLVCSFIGYDSQEICAGTGSLHFTLVPSAFALEGITVASENHGRTEAAAIGIQKQSLNVVNVVSSKSIELSPDLTVANVIQRMSGVTIDRGNTGEGQYAILRGMDKRYNYTLVNGVKIPSPDSKNRFVPLDIFPSELLDRLEVSKSLMANQEGDGIGGAVDLVMKDAPEKRMLNANLSTGYNALFFRNDFTSFDYGKIDRRSPNGKYGTDHAVSASDFTSGNLKTRSGAPVPDIIAGLSYGDRFFGGRLGMMAAVNFQNINRGKESELHYQPGSTYTGVTDRFYSEQQTRTGAHLKLDYRINGNSKIDWYNGYIDMRTAQTRDERNPEWESVRMRWNRQYIFNSTLKGEHAFLKDRALKLNWSAVLSKAFNETPDNVQINLTTAKSGMQTVSVNPAATRRWEHNSDFDKAAYLDLSYRIQLGGGDFMDLSAGGMFRDKIRSSFFNEYTFKLPADNRTQIKGEDWNSFDEIVFEPNSYGNLSDPLNYDASEQIGAAYIMGKYSMKDLELVAGLRMEHTDQGYVLKFPTDGARNSGNQKYYDFLPDLHAKYTVHRNANLRFSYNRAINRPSFFEIVPYNILNEEYKERGNPDLKHTVADNFDLRYEFFPRSSEQIMVGLFYKRIENPIEYGLKTSGQDVFYMPDNFGTAHNYGVEIDVLKYFGNFGIKANYTYTNSSITTPKTLLVPNPDENAETNTVTTTVMQSRPLFGQAAHVANLTLMYKDTDRGWDAQIAGGYTGKRLVSISRYYNCDIWEDGYFRLDFSVEKSFSSGIAVFLKATNILDNPMVRYVPDNKMTEGLNESIMRYGPGIMERIERYGQTIMVGIRYRMTNNQR